MVHRVIVPLIQAGLALAGIAWKLNENFPAYDLPDHGLASEYRMLSEKLQKGDWTWASALVRTLDVQGIVPAALVSTWPLVALHWAMYVSQFTPLVAMMVMESMHQRKAWAALVTVTLLVLANPVIGLSSAMPLTSIIFFALHRLPSSRQEAPPPDNTKKAKQTSTVPGGGVPRGSAGRRLLLGLILLGSTAAHIGLWILAISATVEPTLFNPHAANALHVMNSLAGVPPSPRIGSSDPWAEPWASMLRVARLRQINEMVGTSSGFFAAVGLFCDALAAKGRRVSLEAVLWMFLISLVAGPAAGCASLLLARDWLLEAE
ncbi:hypothetical protein ESCO_005800 [Escovopsis weberi]|uniref:Uncharacterized protein n=1 Tax=Escovopsis weberi TaxID=150374 RepID=A0A0M8MUX1_ESCWE|nr:hypothetical protein ESCO_005800 [Escovopsis weberi]